MNPETARELARRYTVLYRADHPLVDRPPAEPSSDPSPDSGVALRRSGIAEPILDAVQLADVPDPAAAARELPVIAGKAGAEREAVRHAGLYPLLLAGIAALAAVILVSFVRPGLASLSLPIGSAPGAWLAVGACILVLVALGLSTQMRRGLGPVAGARHAQEASLILSVAAVFARHGVPLPRALQASAGVTSIDALRSEAEELASSLKRDGAPPALQWLASPLSVALLTAGAAEGQGAATLSAIAGVAATISERATRRAVVWIEVGSAVTGGLAILIAALAFVHSYTHGLGGL